MILIHDDAQRGWNRYTNPVKTLEAWHIDEVKPLLNTLEALVETQELFAAGFVSYEAAGAFDPAFKLHPPRKGLPLLSFTLFRELRQGSLESLFPYTQEIPDLNWTTGCTKEKYLSDICKIKEEIAQGNTYQVNYTFSLKSKTADSPRRYFRQFIQSGNPAYGAYIEHPEWTILSMSPELFFSLEGQKIHCRPMKGTAPRGETTQRDQKIKQWLYNSEKNRAENLMIVDMIRNDLGRICSEVKTTSLFEIESYPTVFQMTSRVEGRTEAGLADLFTALFPCASITGAPKVSTMNIIRQLEEEPRGLYTGAIGYIHPGRKIQMNVAIRTLYWNKEEQDAYYHVGGGIVWDSEASEEYQEALLKSKVIQKQSAVDFDLFETIRWTPQEGFYLLQEHLHRIKSSAAYWNIPFDLPLLNSTLKQIEGSLKEDSRIKLTLKRDGNLCWESYPLPLAVKAPRIAVSDSKVNPDNPLLYHKTTKREVYELNKKEGFFDTLLRNSRDELTEFTIGNLFLELDGVLYTPPLHCGLLPGTFRARLLKEGKIKEKTLFIQDLEQASRIYLGNGLRGLVEVYLD